MFTSRAQRRATARGTITPGRATAAGAVAIAIVTLLAGCFSVGGGDAEAAQGHSAHSKKTAEATATPAPVTSRAPAAATPTPSPAPPDPAVSHLATPGPVSTSLPAPTLTPVAAGTTVAQGDVASPKGSIHYHYRVVADGDNTYTVQYSGYTSTLPVPVSVTLLEVAPNVGDGLTYHGVGDHSLGGPTTAPQTSTASLGSVGQPGYLTALVTYSGATSATGLPTEIGPGKVLAVTTLHWSIPVRQTNVHPVDHGPRPYATGAVTAKTASGAPRAYRIAPGDTTAVVAERFGISTADLIWLNANLEVFGAQQYLYENTTLNLDPDSL